MIKDKKQSYMCFVNKTTHCAYIVDEKEDEMTLHWEIYNTKETFVETIDGTYVLKSMLKNI